MMRRDRLFELALATYPRDFRRTFGSDMLRMCRESQRAGASRLALWLNVVRSGLGTRFDAMRQSPSGLPQPTLPPAPSAGSWLGDLWRDLRFAVRGLRRSPGFTVVAVASLAIGIGANTGIYSVLDAVLLRTLPVQRPGELVVLHWLAGETFDLDISTSGWGDRNSEDRLEMNMFSYSFYRQLASSQTALADAFAFRSEGSLNARVGDIAERVQGQLVSGNYFDALGVRPWRGRLLQVADDAAAADPVVVLTYPYWQARFGGDTSALGRQMLVNGTEFTIVGVTPPGFEGTGQVGSVAALMVPLATQPRISDRGDRLTPGDMWWLNIMGRRAPGTELERVSASVTPLLKATTIADVGNATEENAPEILALDGARGMPERRRQMREQMLLIGGAVGLVLLIACVNLANLLLARSQARTREIAVRRSLGAGRMRLVRQLLSESVLLALLGGAAGLLVARWVQGGLLALMRDTEIEVTAALDGRALLFCLLVSTLTGIAFGLVPALQASRSEIAGTLQSSASGRTVGRLPLTRSLLTVQVALSLVLLVSAGLFMRSLGNLYEADAGYDPEGLVLFRIDPSVEHYERPDALRLLDDVQQDLLRLSGARSVSYSELLPAGGSMSSTGVNVPDAETRPERGGVMINVVSPTFIDTFEIPLVAGRLLTPDDVAGAPKVVLVGEKFVDTYFPSGGAVGQRLGLGGSDSVPEWEIVGVVGDVAYQNPRDGIYPTVIVPLAQTDDRIHEMTFAVRATGDVGDLAARIRELVRQHDAALPVYGVRTQEAQRQTTLVLERMFALLASGLAIVALVLACIGLYGLLSYSVQRRTREIGVRIALGARVGDIVRLLLAEMLPVAIGIVIGLAGSWAAGQAISSQLYGLEPMDPATLALALAGLLGVAVVAGSLPAHRAARVDPVEALRNE